jgi:hypothetical protein
MLTLECYNYFTAPSGIEKADEPERNVNIMERKSEKWFNLRDELLREVDDLTPEEIEKALNFVSTFQSERNSNTPQALPQSSH